MADKQNEVQVSNSKKLNNFTITAIVMAAVGFWINPFCVLSIMGIVFGEIGVARSDNSMNKTWAIISLGLSIVETLFWMSIMFNTMAAL